MDTLILRIESHRATRHPLFRYLKTHAEDAVSWDIFATHHQRAVAAIIVAIGLLRPRLHAEAREILDHLLETTAAARFLVPPEFTVMGDICPDLERLAEVDRFGEFHCLGMKLKPVPATLGTLYPQCLTPAWSEAMDLLIAPFVERMDLITNGIDRALEVRALLWDSVLEAITGRPSTGTEGKEVKHG